MGVDSARTEQPRHTPAALFPRPRGPSSCRRARPRRLAAYAFDLVDFAVTNPSFTVRKVEAALGISYGRANSLVGQLTDIGVLDVVKTGSQPRRFSAPAVLKVLLT